MVNTAGEVPDGFTYVGQVGGGAFHVIRHWGGEVIPRLVVTSAQSGRGTSGYDNLRMSPDGTRYVSVNDEHADCDQQGDPNLGIWRLTDSVPVIEWMLKPMDCSTGSGWKPSNPVWRAADTLDFVRNDRDSTGYAKRAMVAVFERGGWRILDPR